MASTLEYFNCYIEGKVPILSLSDEDAGKIIKAKYRYFFDDVDPFFPSNSQVKTVWDYEFSKLKRDKHSVYVRSIEARYKVYLRDLAVDSPLNREAWFVASKCSALQKEYPDKAFEMVTVDDMRELDAKSLRRSYKKGFKQTTTDDYDQLDENY